MPRGGQGSRGDKALKGISTETGGRMFEVTKQLPLNQIFDQIQEELRNQYNIGYASPKSSGGGFRKIKLSTKDNKLKVQTREGYYPKSS
jgi:VWFA-related protein